MTNPTESDARRQVSSDVLYLLARWFEPATELRVIEDWDAVLAVANATKTIGLLGPAIADPGVQMPPEVARKVAEARRGILFANLHNIDWTVKTVGPLHEAGIETVVFKGALRSQHVYATMDARRSSDIDLLVRPENYARAREILIADGLIAQVPDDSVWWHRCLGESPYRRPDTASPIVDLHRTVQQPGGPGPTRFDEFFKRSVGQSVGSRSVSTLSPHHALLVCAISYGKAVRAQKPWLAEIHEFAWTLRAMTLVERTTFLDLAKRNRLLRLVTECLGLCDTFFASHPGFVREREALLLASIGNYPKMRFARLRHLWKWIDGAGPVRLGRFGSEMLRIVRSELAFRREGPAPSCQP